jgi:ABC-type Mn2+/Zn2+ transport system ATPase subunit
MIKVQNLNIAINGNLILKDVSLTVNNGSFTVIFGPNGAGKTTLIYSLLGLKKISTGKIIGNDIKFSLVPQRFLFEKNFPISVWDVVFMGLVGNSNFTRMPTKKDKSAVYEVMEKLNILNLKNSLFGETSGGQQQKIIIARALVSNPSVIFFDEPESNLDREGNENINNILSDLKKNGKTIVLVSHDVGSFIEMADTYYYLNQTIKPMDKKDVMFHLSIQAYKDGL